MRPRRRYIVWTGCVAVLLGGFIGCDRSEPAPSTPTPPVPRPTEPVAQPAAVVTEPSAAVDSIPAEPAPPAMDAEAERPPDRLFGTWVAHNVRSKIGALRIRLGLDPSGTARLVAESQVPLVGQVRDASGPLTATDDTLQCDAIAEGTPMKYHFNRRGQLVVEYKEGQSITFSRVDSRGRSRS